MGSVAKIGRGKSARWEARWRTPEGKSRSKRFARERDACAHLAAVGGAIVSGAYVDAAAGKVTFREYAEDWRGRQVQHRATSKAHVETMLRRHAYPFLGERPLGAITPDEVQGWVTALREGDETAGRKPLAASTVGVVHSLVFSVMKAAVRSRRIASNPCEGTRLPEVVRGKVVPPTTEQVEVLAGAVPERLRALVWLTAGTGMRQGEVLGLTVDRLRMLRREVVVDRQLVTLPRQAPTFAPPKTKASDRVIPMPQAVVEVMAAHLKAFPPGPAGFVFTLDDGEPISRSAFGHVWRPAARAAELDPGTGMHALRHYYASLLIRFGESVKTVQARLGHATAAETLDTYAHLWPDSDDRTREAIDSVLGKRDAPEARGTGH